MIKKMYVADAGSIQVQCGESYISIDNNYGDGQFKAYLFDSEKEFNSYKEEHYSFPCMRETNYRFAGLHYFNNAHVLNYDCWEPGKNHYFIFEKEILFTLNGRFAVYVNNGKVYFVKENIKEAANYKMQLLAKINSFKEAYNDLKTLFESDADDCNKYICDNYPFDKSFDELNISDWINSIEENLKKGDK